MNGRQINNFKIKLKLGAVNKFIEKYLIHILLFLIFFVYLYYVHPWIDWDFYKWYLREAILLFEYPLFFSFVKNYFQLGLNYYIPISIPLLSAYFNIIPIFICELANCSYSLFYVLFSIIYASLFTVLSYVLFRLLTRLQISKLEAMLILFSNPAIIYWIINTPLNTADILFSIFFITSLYFLFKKEYSLSLICALLLPLVKIIGWFFSLFIVLNILTNTKIKSLLSEIRSKIIRSVALFMIIFLNVLFYGNLIYYTGNLFGTYTTVGVINLIKKYNIVYNEDILKRIVELSGQDIMKNILSSDFVLSLSLIELANYPINFFLVLFTLFSLIFYRKLLIEKREKIFILSSIIFSLLFMVLYQILYGTLIPRHYIYLSFLMTISILIVYSKLPFYFRFLILSQSLLQLIYYLPIVSFPLWRISKISIWNIVTQFNFVNFQYYFIMFFIIILSSLCLFLIKKYRFENVLFTTLLSKASLFMFFILIILILYLPTAIYSFYIKKSILETKKLLEYQWSWGIKNVTDIICKDIVNSNYSSRRIAVVWLNGATLEPCSIIYKLDIGYIELLNRILLVTILNPRKNKFITNADVIYIVEPTKKNSAYFRLSNGINKTFKINIFAHIKSLLEKNDYKCNIIANLNYWRITKCFNTK